jgi:hypothetical protein
MQAELRRYAEEVRRTQGLEVTLHEASVGKIFKLDDLHAILMQGKHLLEEEMADEP